MSAALAPAMPNDAATGRFNPAVPRSASRTSLVNKAAEGRQKSAVNVGTSSPSSRRSHPVEVKTDASRTAVAVRIRPPPPPQDPTIASVPPRFRASRCRPTDPTTLAIDTAQGRKQLTFDRVFSDAETQEGIWNYVSGAVDAFVQGYNVSILAYGQSGAGKSYTMGTLNPGEQTSMGEKGTATLLGSSWEELFADASRNTTTGCGGTFQEDSRCQSARRWLWA